MGKIIFDIGCCNGMWIDANFNRDDRFVGVEPRYESYKQLVKKYKHEPKVDIINALVADKPGSIKFYDCKEVSTCSKQWMAKSRHSFNEWGKVKKVESITLDYLIELYGTPDYVKVDVEGFEYEVLLGLSKKVGMIAFEFVEELANQLYKCLDRLKELGYTDFNWSHGDQYDYVPDSWMTYDEITDYFKGLIVPKRKQCWGMCYAK